MEKSYRSEFIEKLNGDGAVYEKDILNIILSNAYGGRDMSGIADKLLSRFPSVKSIICAALKEISAVEGVSESVALYLKTLGRIEELKNEKQFTHIKDTEDFYRLLANRFSGCDNEFAEFFFVNSRGKIVDRKTYTSEIADMVEIPTSEIVSALTTVKPYGMYYAHNHVNCSPNPSNADDRLTGKIAQVCAACSVKLFDHAIINSDGEIYSYLQSGRLNEIMNR